MNIINSDPANPKGCGIVNIWQESVPVRFGAIDKSDKMTMHEAFKLFQEAAISHAENLGVGREDMARTGQVWILSRMSVIADRRPSYRETVLVRSWPQGWEKLFAIRNYEIRDKDDIAVVSSRSAWLIVDMEKRRPLRPQSVMDFLPQNEGVYALSPEAGGAAGLEERAGLQKIAEKKALYNDLDYNGHVNNVSYIKWIEDSLEAGLLEKAQKMRLDINYLSETHEGEIIDIMSSAAADDDCSAFAFEGRKRENIKQGSALQQGFAFRAELRLWGV